MILLGFFFFNSVLNFHISELKKNEQSINKKNQHFVWVMMKLTVFTRKIIFLMKYL